MAGSLQNSFATANYQLNISNNIGFCASISRQNAKPQNVSGNFTEDPKNKQTDKAKTKMRFIIQTFLLLIITIQFVYAQKKLPTLKTNKNSINIKEGNSEYKDIWTISPEVNPDIFVTNPFVGTKKIIFYSNIDSISFTVKPNKKYDFIILLNGKDKAFTQISTDSKEKPSLEPKLFYTRLKNANQETDTIPFTLGKDNGIHLKGKINDSDTLDFLFDTGAGICVIPSSIINQKVNLTIDGSQENGGTDGVATVDKSSKNTIEINNLKWEMFRSYQSIIKSLLLMLFWVGLHLKIKLLKLIMKKVF